MTFAGRPVTRTTDSVVLKSRGPDSGGRVYPNRSENRHKERMVDPIVSFRLIYKTQCRTIASNFTYSFYDVVYEVEIFVNQLTGNGALLHISGKSATIRTNLFDGTLGKILNPVFSRVRA